MTGVKSRTNTPAPLRAVAATGDSGRGAVTVGASALMVRKGSPVRVRQRALKKPLETAAFSRLWAADAASAKDSQAAFGPHTFRKRSDAAVWGRGQRLLATSSKRA